MSLSEDIQRNLTKQLPVQLNLDTVTPATRLLEKQRQMLEIQDSLDIQKEEYNKKEDIFKRRVEQLRKKDLELKESFIRFIKFLKENEIKRVRAQKKADDEEKSKQEKISLIEKERILLHQVKIQKQILEKQLSQNKRYLKYLESVKESNETEFPEIEYIIRRYNILISELESSQQRQSYLNSEIERVQKSYQSFTKEQINNNLGLGTESAHLVKKLEKAESDLSQLENSLDSDMKNISDRTSTISRVMMAVENVYYRCKSESKVLEHAVSLDKTKIDDGGKALTIARLDIIGDYIQDYTEIVAGYEAYKKEEAKNKIKAKLKAPVTYAQVAPQTVPNAPTSTAANSSNFNSSISASKNKFGRMQNCI